LGDELHQLPGDVGLWRLSGSSMESSLVKIVTGHCGLSQIRCPVSKRHFTMMASMDFGRQLARAHFSIAFCVFRGKANEHLAFARAF